jgi:TolA-binding protein
MQRPEGPNPETPAEMAKLIAGSSRKHGARYQRRISDGYNPFGSSDYYISVYRGWLRVPKAGKCGFCTVSNEASFSYLDGKELVHWPGRHTAERGARGEFNATVELSAGYHYVEYYHEEVTLEQMAFLGWRPSANDGPFAPIPEEVFPAPHDARVMRYESPAGPLLHFEPIISDSLWPTNRNEGQYTRVKFAAGRPPAPAGGTVFTWEFGDGQTATGAEVDHIYLALRPYVVTLTASGSGGATKAAWPLDVYEIENITDQFREGRPGDYATVADKYDRVKLDPRSLKELAFLFAEADRPPDAAAVGNEFVTRFATSKPEWVPGVRRLIADCSLLSGQAKVDDAIANYQASLTNNTSSAERFDVLSRLIRLLGLERDLPKKADDIFAQVEEAARGLKMDDDTRAAYRKAIIAAGDVRLWHGRADDAHELYRRSEANGPFIPANVRAARVGAYPNSLREYIAGGNHGAALDLVEKWETTFPTEKLHGQTFFWRGKLLYLRGQYRDAARYLEQSAKVAAGAVSEPEARWLLALSFEQLGRGDDAKRELAKLIALGGQDEFSKKARAKLQK